MSHQASRQQPRWCLTRGQRRRVADHQAQLASSDGKAVVAATRRTNEIGVERSKKKGQQSKFGRFLFAFTNYVALIRIACTSKIREPFKESHHHVFVLNHFLIKKSSRNYSLSELAEWRSKVE